MIDMEVCQEGIEGTLPSWCVEMDLGWETWVQLGGELCLLLIIFTVSYAIFKWKRKKDVENEMIQRMNEDNTRKLQIKI